MNWKEKLDRLRAEHENLLARKNEAFYVNGVYERYKNPILTAAHAPIEWRYELDEKNNPFLMERIGIHAVFNSGAIKWKGRYLLVTRVEADDRKSFFAVAESPNGVDNFRFWPRPVTMPEYGEPATNIYDMRLTAHEDGWIYGLFCVERKDHSAESDLSAATACCGIARTRDFVNWERLPDLKSRSQQRNVCLHPEFVNGKYAFYTRPMDDFINTGSGGGIGFGLCDDITHAVIDEEKIISKRVYHTITEAKNGAGATPIKTSRGWIHISHGVRNTADGLRYVLYVYATALDDPSCVIAEPGGVFLVPLGSERTGDVSNVVFTNGAIEHEGKIYIYYASSDTRMHVATTTVDKMIDYVFNTPSDPHRSPDCVKQRCQLIKKNLELLK